MAKKTPKVKHTDFKDKYESEKWKNDSLNKQITDLSNKIRLLESKNTSKNRKHKIITIPLQILGFVSLVCGIFSFFYLDLNDFFDKNKRERERQVYIEYLNEHIAISDSLIRIYDNRLYIGETEYEDYFLPRIEKLKGKPEFNDTYNFLYGVYLCHSPIIRSIQPDYYFKQIQEKDELFEHSIYERVNYLSNLYHRSLIGRKEVLKRLNDVLNDIQKEGHLSSPYYYALLNYHILNPNSTITDFYDCLTGFVTSYGLKIEYTDDHGFIIFVEDKQNVDLIWNKGDKSKHGEFALMSIRQSVIEMYCCYHISKKEPLNDSELSIKNNMTKQFTKNLKKNDAAKNFFFLLWKLF